MPEGTITTIGGLDPTNYSFSAGVKPSNGYFVVNVKGSPEGTQITSSEMLFILYAIHQSVNSQKVQRNAEVAEYLTNYSTAVSNLTKVFALYSASFDGEYVKQGMAPEGAIGMIKGYSGSAGDDYDEVKSWGDADATDNEDGDHPVDVNAKTVQMTAEHVKEALQNYVAAHNAYQTLTTDYKSALEDLNVSLSEFPTFPFGSDFVNYQEPPSDLSVSGDLAKNYRAFTKGSPDSSGNQYQSVYAQNFLSSWNALNLGPCRTIGTGNFQFTTQSGDEQNQGASVHSIVLGSADLTIKEGDTDDVKLSKVAFHLFSRGQTILNAAGASERKETYNNEMNQANTFTQTVSQAASRALSKVDSLQSMVDRNMNKIFENLTTIARGGS